MSVSSRRQFKFALIPSIAYILFMVLLLSLGRWQLERADEKQALFDAFKSASTEAISLSDALDLAQPRYQHVQLTGQFKPKYQYLLDNMVNAESVPGSQVYTPFQVENGSWVLVNRGWILDTLRQPGLVLEAQIPDGEYPKTVQFPTFEQLGADLGQELVPYQLLLNAAEVDINVTDGKNDIGFLREWKPHEMGPESHLGYLFGFEFS